MNTSLDFKSRLTAATALTLLMSSPAMAQSAPDAQTALSAAESLERIIGVFSR